LLIDKNDNLQYFFADHDLDTLTLWKKLAKNKVENIKNDIRMQNQILKNRRDSNVTYGMLNGETKALKFVETSSVSRKNIKYVLIFSDGMLVPRKNPKESEDFKSIAKLFKEGGLSRVKSYIRELENTDPECIKYPRTKQHDDLTAIAITF
jgi:hypothetical protein